MSSSNFASFQIAPSDDPGGYQQARAQQEYQESPTYSRGLDVGGSSSVTHVSPEDGIAPVVENRKLTTTSSSEALNLEGKALDLSSLQSSYGAPKSPESGQVTPGDTIEVAPGIRTRVSVAAALGYVKLENGHLTHATGVASSAQASSVSPTDAQQQQQDQQQPKGPSHVQALDSDPHSPGQLKDPSHEAAITTLNQALGPMELKAVQADLIRGQVSQQTVEALSAALSATPAEVNTLVEKANEGYRQLWTDSLSQAGASTPKAQQEFLQWAARNRTPQLQKAQQDMFNFTAQSGLASLARDFMSNYDVIDPEQTRLMVEEDLGWKTRPMDNGEGLMVQHPQMGWMSWTQAYRAGLFATPKPAKTNA